jgi:3-methyladenine DNA glycosylase AlkD
MSAKEIQKALRLVIDPKRAVSAPRFFKTGAGQYGEGDRFLGVPVPAQREIAKTWQAEPLPELGKLVTSPIHEERLTGLLILVRQFEQANRGRSASPDTRQLVYEFYVRNLDSVNNWDLVDSSAPNILGNYLLTQPTSARKQLVKLARSQNQWHRRIALLATYAFIRVDQFEDTLKLTELLLSDAEDLIHKAAGWMLREVGKRDGSVLREFLNRHALVMPRTQLRYALEKLPSAERQRYLNAGRASKSGPSHATRRRSGARAD